MGDSSNEKSHLSSVSIKKEEGLGKAKGNRLEHGWQASGTRGEVYLE